MQTTGTKHLWLAIALAGSVSLFNATASAESYTFSRNSGGWSPGSIDRSLVAPCHSAVSAKLSGARYDHYDSDIPISIEFRAPGVSMFSPPTHVRVFMARMEDQRFETLSVPGHDSGCGASWKIRIVPSPTTWETRIVGDLSLGFDKASKRLVVEDAVTLLKGRSTLKNLGDANGIAQGWVEITGTWNQSIFGVPGPMPVKLTFELLKPDGSIAAFDSGHSNHEFNPCCSNDKMKLRFLVREHLKGQWKMRVTNDSGSDAMSVVPRATLRSECQ